MLQKLYKKIFIVALTLLTITPLNSAEKEIQVVRLSRTPLSELTFPKAVFIDWDNTISHVWPPLHTIMNKTLTAFGKDPLSMEDFLNLPDIGMPQAEQIKWLFKEPRQDVVEVYWQNYHDHHHKEPLEIDEFAGELLAHFKSNGVFIAAVSNQEQKVLEGNVTKSGLRDYFDVAVGSIRDQPGENKPSAGAIRRALRNHPPLAEQIGKLHNDWWFIGDSDIDMLTALNTQCLPVWVTQYAIKDCVKFTDDQSNTRGLEVESLKHLLDTLQQLKK